LSAVEATSKYRENFVVGKQSSIIIDNIHIFYTMNLPQTHK
jgi:hypothetical protein